MTNQYGLKILHSQNNFYRHAVELRGKFPHLQSVRVELLLHSFVLGLAPVELILHSVNLVFIHILHLRLERRRLLVEVTAEVLKGVVKSVVIFGGKGLVWKKGRGGQIKCVSS